MKLLPLIRKSQGFSLVEIMVVFTIIAIVSGMGFASFKSYSDSQIVTNATQDVKLAIETAKFNATSSVTPPGCTSLMSYRFTYNKNQGTYRVEANCGQSVIVTLTKTIPSAVTFSQSSTCVTLTYSILSGQLNGGNCNIIIQGGTGVGSKTITVDVTGNTSTN